MAKKSKKKAKKEKKKLAAKKLAGKKSSANKKKSSPAKKATATPRQSWLDDSKQTPLIDEYTQKLTTFIDALADGRIDGSELSGQEKRLVACMKEVEPMLDGAQHAGVTRLLCELTAYNVMQTLNSLEVARPKSAFQG